MDNADQALQATFWIMIALQTMGSVDMPGSGDRKMPAPRAYLATLIIWSILQMGADAGYGRAARSSAWLIVLVGLVFGPFGQKVVDLFTRVADIYSPGSGQNPNVFDTLTGPQPFAPPTNLPNRTRTGQPTRPVAQSGG